MKKIAILLIILMMVSVGFLSGCTEKIIEGSGTIQFNDFEGGFYGIAGDDGEHYDPINLPPEFREDGIRVKYTLKILEGVASTHMWGYVVVIIKIEKIS